MKIIKPVEFPLELILQGLKSSEPKYITSDGVRVSLYDVAVSLITGLLSQVDEAESEKREAYALLEKLFPGPPNWGTQQCVSKRGQTPHCDQEKNTSSGAEEASFPAATVIAAIVKQAVI